MKSVAAVLLGALLFAAGDARAQGDLALGEKVFQKCKVCHEVETERDKVGPTLVNVIGRQPGTLESFARRYSPAMKKYGEDHVWDEATLTEYLANPREVVKGTRMVFPGLKESEEISAVIAYLKQFSEGK